MQEFFESIEPDVLGATGSIYFHWTPIAEPDGFAMK